jgi:hypothetical protein
MAMKRWFWAVSCDNTTADPFVADEAELEYEDSALRVGRKVEAWQETACVKATAPENDGEPDDVLQTCLAVPIYSRRLRLALDEGGIGGIQYLPIRVVRPNGELIAGFSVANILNCVDALDLRLSAVSRYPADYFLPARRGLIRSVNAPVLVRSAVAAYDIIRLSVFTPSVYVSERFERIFRDGDFTGYSFQEVPTGTELSTVPPG